MEVDGMEPPGLEHLEWEGGYCIDIEGDVEADAQTVNEILKSTTLARAGMCDSGVGWLECARH